MELKQRKRINNLTKFDLGKSGSLDALDAKVNPYYQSGVAKDLTNMIGSNAPSVPFTADVTVPALILGPDLV